MAALRNCSYFQILACTLGPGQRPCRSAPVYVITFAFEKVHRFLFSAFIELLLSCAVASEALKGLVSNKTHLGLLRIQPEVWVTYWWSHVHQRPATRRWESDLSVIWKDLGNGHLLLEDPVNHDLPRSPNSCLSRRSGTFTFSCASVHLPIEPDWNISCGILRSILQDYNKCEHI